MDDAELRRLAEAATPGPWRAPLDYAPEDRTVPRGTDLHAVRDSGPHWPGFFLGAVESKADAAYIAAANPTVILDLLDRAASASDEGSLDAAWAEAEAALPSGHTMDLTLENHVDGGRYLAWTMRHTDRAIIRGEGTTPAAALRVLAAGLRSIPPASEPETP